MPLAPILSFGEPGLLGLETATFLLPKIGHLKPGSNQGLSLPERCANWILAVLQALIVACCCFFCWHHLFPTGILDLYKMTFFFGLYYGKSAFKIRPSLREYGYFFIKILVHLVSFYPRFFYRRPRKQITVEAPITTINTCSWKKYTIKP